ncbi:DUF1559 family PulG-like putative transporter [Lignipirellula cremea]|uniref:DUF1559 domain-containing protein n=1 Tax=Lignipirellula cremea TaxID=2528010 RepID=A0A518E201_9BACT|nr:DUF1559 domain-containing protein [Lignipirellula cremea]QDU98117.1 hypothetical protein Pla8534_59780 [Lignipirellula cremea]
MRNFTLLVLASCMAILLPGCSCSEQKSRLELAAMRKRGDQESAAPSAPAPAPAKKPPAAEAPAKTPEPVQETPAAAPAPPRPKYPTPATLPSFPALSSAAADASPSNRRQAGLERLARISKAMIAYREQTGRLPPAAITGGDPPRPLLSWRVLLLPYLGEQELYEQFHLDESWDSEHNQPLLARMPDVYRSAEAEPGRTLFQIPKAQGGLFEAPGGLPEGQVSDGLAHTLMLLEVDADYSTPWSRPTDHLVTENEALTGLGKLRRDGFFAAWGDGSLCHIPNDIASQRLFAVFTAGGSEGITAAHVSQPAVAEVPGTRETVASRSPLAEFEVASELPSELPSSAASSGPLFETAESLFAQGFEKEAMAYYFAGVATSPGAEPWNGDWRWFAGARRPAPLLRWGLGIEVSGVPDNKTSLDPIAQFVNRYPTPAEGENLTKYVGEFGGWAYSMLPRADSYQMAGRRLPLPRAVSAVEPQPLDERHPADPIRRLAPGVFYLGTLDRNPMLQLAEREGIDIAIVFKVEIKVTKTGVSNTTSAEIIDMWTRERILETRQLNNRQVALIRQNPLKEDPLKVVMEQVQSRVVGEFSGVALPATLLPEHVRGRIATLAGARVNNPLPALAEIRFYLARGLIGKVEAQAACTEIVGEQKAEALFSVDATERLSAVKEWLPELRLTP